MGRELLDGTRDQAQAGRPALGASLQRRHLLSRQLEAQLRQEVHRLIEREAQVGEAEFRQFAASTQPGKGKWGIVAADRHEVQLRRESLRQVVG